MKLTERAKAAWQLLTKGTFNSFESTYGMQPKGLQQKTNGQGYAVLSAYDLMQIAAKDKDGNSRTFDIPSQYDYVDSATAITIYSKCDTLFSVVNKTAKTISSISKFKVKHKGKEFDNLERMLRDNKDIFLENLNSALAILDKDNTHKWKHFYAASEALARLITELPELIFDWQTGQFVNFEKAMLRLSRKYKVALSHSIAEIENFIFAPNPYLTWREFIETIVQDFMLHRGIAVQVLNDNLYILPGGTIYPVKGKYIGDEAGYVQFIPGGEQPLFFNYNDIIYAQYLPNSIVGIGMSPLDVLVDLIASQLMIDDFMSEYSNKETPPEKLLVFGKDATADFSAITNDDPMNKDEQKRIETILNRSKRENAIKILSGYGQPFLLDLSRENVMGQFIQWREVVDRSIARVYGLSNLEVNLTAPSGTSGRSVAEVLERQDNSKAHRPMIVAIEDLFSQRIIPAKYGFDYYLESDENISESEKIDIATKKANSGLFTKNEIRMKDYELDPHESKTADDLVGQAPEAAAADVMKSIQTELSKRNG